MKKLAMISAVALTTALLHAQGLVSLYTFSGTMATNSAFGIYSGGDGTGGVSGATSTAANSFYYTVLISATNPGDNNPLDAGWAQAIYAGSPLLANNYALGGDVLFNNGQATAIDNWASGATMYYEIVGWSAGLGSDWSTVSGLLSSSWAGNGNQGFFGVSSLGSGASGVPPTGTALNLFSGVGNGFTMYAVPVPEPATMALAGLGGLSLLLFRRRKN